MKKIHAFPNHCILFCGETFKSLDKYPGCGASRYKNNDLYGGDEASTGKKRNTKGTKKVHYTTTPKLAMDDLTLKAVTATDNLTLKSYSDRLLQTP